MAPILCTLEIGLHGSIWTKKSIRVGCLERVRQTKDDNGCVCGGGGDSFPVARKFGYVCNLVDASAL